MRVYIVVAIFIAFVGVAYTWPFNRVHSDAPRQYSTSDRLTVPFAIEHKLEEALPHTLVSSPNCNSEGTSTVCVINFEFLTVQSGPGHGVCIVSFYGGKLDSVFEDITCTVGGRPSRSITEPEERQLAEIQKILTQIVISMTSPQLAAAGRHDLMTRMYDTADHKFWDDRRVGEWTYSLLSESAAPNLKSASAGREFTTVRDEHRRRYGLKLECALRLIWNCY